MAAVGLFTARDELERVLDPERAQAVIDHRQAKRSKLTAYAAKLLAQQFARCADPAAAADAMILNGWTGFKPEWLERQNAPRSMVRSIDAAEADLRRRIHEQGFAGAGDDSAETPERLSIGRWNGHARPH